MTFSRLAAVAAAVLALAANGTPAFAQQQDTAVERLTRQVDALSRELETLRLGEDVVVRADTSTYGLGPAASKVYRAREGVSVGGYGEVLYKKYASELQNGSPAGRRDELDALRLIMYLGYKFNPRLLFNSEVEFEHGSTEYGGSVSVEFAYVDWLASSKLGVRGGLLLVPMGFINELHEPPVFLGTMRPMTESSIIPSTWRENGVGVFGDLGSLSYRAYVINGFDAIGGRYDEAEGFSAGGLRDARQSGSHALIENPALVARVDYSAPALRGLLVGASAYAGNSGQGAQTSNGRSIDAFTRILEAHAQYRANGFDLRALVASASVNDAALVNQAHGFTGSESIGEDLRGWYVQAGYDVLRSSTQQLLPYVRYESMNTQQNVPAGFSANPALDKSATTIGAMWKPITNIAVKADYTLDSNQAETGINQFNVSLGYLF